MLAIIESFIKIDIRLRAIDIYGQILSSAETIKLKINVLINYRSQNLNDVFKKKCQVRIHYFFNFQPVNVFKSVKGQQNLPKYRL